jgi:ribosomal protein S18 acetylase RimI-like enzyme
MKEIFVRKATKNDAVTIASFQVSMALETENYQLDLNTVSKGVMNVFDQTQLGCYYIAEFDGQAVASLLTTYEWSDWRNTMIIWIQSVYVVTEFRNKGIFKSMYTFIKEMVGSDPSYGGIRLYVDKSNLAAQEVYDRLGMNGEHYKVFEWMK